jgi:hypothetical protein
VRRLWGQLLLPSRHRPSNLSSGLTRLLLVVSRGATAPHLSQPWRRKRRSFRSPCALSRSFSTASPHISLCRSHTVSPHLSVTPFKTRPGTPTEHPPCTSWNASPSYSGCQPHHAAHTFDCDDLVPPQMLQQNCTQALRVVVPVESEGGQLMSCLHLPAVSKSCQLLPP